MTIAELKNISWKLFEGNPLIRPPFPSPIVADPSFLTPDKTPDQRWHLFAHSLMGIHHYVSDNGIKWKRLSGLITFKALRPFIYFENGTYYLFYEKFTSVFPFHSFIELKTSTDLINWSDGKNILEPGLPWQFDDCKLGNAGNACLIKDDGHYKLYFSSGLVYLDDCRFVEPRHIGFATSQNIDGPYTYHPEAVIKRDEQNPIVNLGAGAIKVLKLSDGYAGFHNGIYWNDKTNHSGSRIQLLFSKDGIEWNAAEGIPLLSPNKGWMSSHLYALDVKEYRGTFYLYFNARNGYVLATEKIGLMTGS